MSVQDLTALYEAIDVDQSLLPFPLFVEMVGDETNVSVVLSWFKHTVLH